MITEIKVFQSTSNVSGFKNGNFKYYTNSWDLTSGTTTAAIYPSLTDPTALQAITNPKGWTWNNGYMVHNSGNTTPLQQSIDGLEQDKYYRVIYSVVGYEEMAASETVTVSLYGDDGSTATHDGQYVDNIKITNSLGPEESTTIWCNTVSGNTYVGFASGNYSFLKVGTIITGNPYITDGSVITGFYAGGFIIDNAALSTKTYVATIATNIESSGKVIAFTPTSNFVGGISKIQVLALNSKASTLDLYSDESFNLTFEIQKSIADKAATYSKTIKIPGTANNNLIFNNLMDIGRYIDPDTIQNNTTIFLNKKLMAGIYSDSLELLIGNLEINSVSNTDGIIEYECVFYSNTKTLGDVIGEKLCNGNEDSGDDLDFSEYNHIHDWRTIYATMDPNSIYYTGSTGIFYPIIDYAKVDSGNEYRIEQFKPTLYIKEIWDKIFSKAGFTYTSTFLNDTIFKSLVIPVGNTLEEVSLYYENSKFKVGVAADYDGIVRIGTPYWAGWDWERVKFDKVTGGSMFNGANNVVPYDPVNYQWTVSKVGSYTFSAQVNYSIYFPSGPAFLPWKIGSLNVAIKLCKRSVGLGGGETTVIESPPNKHNLPEITYTPPCYVISGATISIFTDEPIDCKAGDTFYIMIQLYGENFWSKTTQVSIVNDKQLHFIATDESAGNTNYSYFLNMPTTKYNYYLTGQYVFANDILPRKMKQIDFIKSVSNKFNLMFAEDKTITNNFIIEPYDTFYLTGDTLDWSNKVDRSKEMFFQRVPYLLDKDVAIKFKEDSNDEILNNYKETYNKNFGDKYVKNLYYADGVEIITDEFSSTELGQLGTTNLIVSKIHKEGTLSNANTEGSPVPSDTDYNYRVLYRQILTSANTGVIPFSTINITDSPNIVTDNDGKTTITSVVLSHIYSFYPYAGFLDNPYNPTLDLNYDIAKAYNSTVGLTANNLGWLYWNKKLTAYLDINSKLLTCYISLNYSDIAQLDFRRQIYIDNHLYKLQKITEWTPRGSCKVELMQVQPLNEDAYVSNKGWEQSLLKK